MGSPVLPGRLGSPGMTLRDDPRADPRMIAAMEPLGLGRPAGAGAGRRRLVARGAARVLRRGRGGLRGAVRRASSPGMPDGRRASSEPSRSSSGLDGNDITLYLHRPAGVDGPLPGVLHLHGGGMVLLEAAGAGVRPLARRARRRRAWSSSASSSATAAASTVRTRSRPGSTTARRRCGGSSTTRHDARHLQADRVGRVRRREPDPGHGAAGQARRAARRRSTASTRSAPTSPTPGPRRPPELTSLFENDGYFLEVPMMGALAKVYDPTGEHATDPLAWPYHAAPRGPRRPAAARHLGEPARPAARRGPRLLPQAARRRGAGRQPDGQRHVPRRRLHLRRRHARRVPAPPSATSRASPTRCSGRRQQGVRTGRARGGRGP